MVIVWRLTGQKWQPLLAQHPVSQRMVKVKLGSKLRVYAELSFDSQLFQNCLLGYASDDPRTFPETHDESRPHPPITTNYDLGY